MTGDDATANDWEDDYPCASSGPPYVPPEWRNICDSFIDPLADEVGRWLREFPDPHQDEKSIVDHLENFAWILVAIVDGVGSQDAEYTWNRAKVWLDVNVSVEFRSQFEDEVKHIKARAKATRREFLGADAEWRGAGLDTFTLRDVESFLTYLTNTSRELRPLVGETGKTTPTLNAGETVHRLPALFVNCRKSQVRYLDEVHDLTGSQADVLDALVKAKGDWVPLSKRGITKPSEVTKKLPDILQTLIESESGKGYRLKRLP